MSSYKHRVQYYETDMMGVVHHSNYIRWFEEARVELLKDMGISYKKMEEDGIISPILFVSCKYLDNVCFDDLVEVKIIIESLGSYKLHLRYEIIDVLNGKIKAVGETKQGFVSKEGNIISIKKDIPLLYEKLLMYMEC